MPEIRLRHVVSCSSQDPTHSADNLLKADTYRKWRSAKAGEKQISVILQLEKEEQIHSIDVGNEGSAFVEVLAGSSAAGSGEQDYEVLLVTSSFMSPTESRSGTNSNRVRLFGSDKLVRATAEKRWDRVKVVCSQPYCKDSPYGLSFIRLHSPPDKDKEEPEAAPPKVTKLGAFRVREDDGASGSLRPGALFFSRVSKTSPGPAKEQPGPSYAAATLQASERPCAPSPPASPGRPPAPSRAPSKPQESPKGKRKLDVGQDEPANRQRPPGPAAHPKPPAPKKSRGETGRGAGREAGAEARTPLPPITGLHRAGFSSRQERPSWACRAGEGPGRRRGGAERLPEPLPLGAAGQGPGAGRQVPAGLDRRQHPPHLCLRQHAQVQRRPEPGRPHRAQGVGAGLSPRPPQAALTPVPHGGPRLEQRRRDAAPHPKGRAGLGPLVPHPPGPGGVTPGEPQRRQGRREGFWVGRLDSPMTQPALLGPVPKRGAVTPPPALPQHPPAHQQPSSRTPSPPESQGATDTEEEPADAQDDGTDDSGDTEDELRRVAEQREQKRPPDPAENGGGDDDPYAGTTDENTDDEGPEPPDLPIPELPDFFQGKHFFLYGEFPGEERRQLVRYVTAFDGEIEDYMNERVQFVITAQDWDPSFEEALLENPSLAFVRPRWIYSCNERQKWLPYQLYGVVPRA